MAVSKGTIPTLTLDGFLNTKKLQMSKLFEYYLASDFSQSNTFYGGVCSLKYVLAKSGGDAVSIKRGIESDLNKLYGNHFTSVTTDVGVYEPEGTGKIIVEINLSATFDNETFTLNKTINYDKGDIEGFNDMLDKYYELYKGNN